MPDAPHQELAAFRAQTRATIGPRYSGALHFAFTNLLALSAMAWAAAQLVHPRWALLTIPITLLYANAVEYFAHRGPMHRPARGLRLVYERHTLLHHRFFQDDAMELQSRRDFKLVLFPPLLIAFFFGLFGAPLYLVVRLLLGQDVAALFILTALAYFLLYEWLHLTYHLSSARLPRWLASLRSHHAAHHDPRAMSAGNFNITFPICDAFFETRLGTRLETRA